MLRRTGDGLPGGFGWFIAMWRGCVARWDIVDERRHLVGVSAMLVDDRPQVAGRVTAAMRLTRPRARRAARTAPTPPAPRASRRRAPAHSTDRGHPFQADRGQRSRRSRTPWVGCLSDSSDGRPTVRHQFGTLSEMNVEQGLPGCPPGAEGVFDAVVVGLGSLVHGGGVACDEQPPRWARRCRSHTRLPRWGCRQAGVLARRSDSPLSASVCEPCSSRSMMASAMVGSFNH